MTQKEDTMPKKKHIINPMIDCVFKAILGSEKNKNLIIHFLNAVLELCGPDRITDITLLNPYNERNFITDKLSVVDVKARQANDEHIQIEVQLNAHPALSERMLFTWAAIYRSQIQKGQNYSDLNPVISIWLVGDTLFKHENSYHFSFSVFDTVHQLPLTDHLKIHILQTPGYALNENQITDKDRWMYFFKSKGHLDIENPPDFLNTREMRQAMSVLTEFSENETNYLLYQSRLDAQFEIDTWKSAIERERQEKEKERQEKELALLKAAKEHQEKELALLKVEKENQEKNRLLKLLKQAGIDPDQELLS